MCAETDIGVWQTALQHLDACPLLGRSHFGVLAPDDHVAWCHGFAGVFWELREVLTQTLRAIMHVSWPVATGCKCLVGDRFDRFVHREDAGCLPRLLFLCAVQSDPLGDETLLVLVERELCSSLLTIALLFRAEISTEAPIRLRRNVLRGSLVRGNIKKQTAALGDDVAALGRRWWMGNGPLTLVR